MANREKGEVSFEAGGKQYTLRYSSNALCELEDALNLGINDIIARMKNMRVKDARAIFWAGLTDNHPDIDLKAAGRMLDEIKIEKATSLITEAFSLAFGKGEKAETKDARPQNGTGENS